MFVGEKMNIYINRVLNLKKIKAIGMDMDHTLVRYHVKEFEELTYHVVLNKLVASGCYPKEILDLSFDFNKAILGLAIDKKHGNLIKLSRYGKVKAGYHGNKALEFSEQKKLYENREIDLSGPDIDTLDTSFSLSHGVLFANLVEFINENKITEISYSKIADDIKKAVDIAHRDGTLKNEVRKNLKKYIIQDKDTPRMLEQFKQYGKKLLVITNSDYSYTKLLLDFTINPFLSEHKSWEELFEITVVFTMKPRFFTDRSRFLKIDPDTGMMSNYDSKLVPGIYQGGNAETLQDDLGLEGSEILYLGDHIFGDILKLKKNCNWRTALVLSPLEDDLIGLKKSITVQKDINELMIKKDSIEKELIEIYSSKNSNDVNDKKDALYKKLEKINSSIGKKIEEYQSHFNPYWGELMRAGQEESRLAGQVEKYACIYMCKLSDLMNCSPKTYFRPKKRMMAHEFDLD